MNGLDLFTADMRELVMQKIRIGYEYAYEVKGLRKDGTQYDLRIHGKQIPYHGRIVRVAEFRDISENKIAEEKIKNLLAEKELILKEVHHRIKNNMSTMMSLLSIQADNQEDPGASAALLNARDRLHSMGVLYDKLYRAEDFSEMSIKDYLPPLVKEIAGMYANLNLVKFETDIEDFSLNVKKISPLGIIINELLTNSIKYAFPGKADGIIKVSASSKDNRATVIIEDNGMGIPESFNMEKSKGFGYQLVVMLTKQIGGILNIERKNGTKFIIEFELTK